MEHMVAEEKCMTSNEDKRPHQAAKSKTRKGGFRTMPFIIGTQIFNFYTYAPTHILVLYVNIYICSKTLTHTHIYICKYMLNLFVDFHFFDGDSE